MLLSKGDFSPVGRTSSCEPPGRELARLLWFAQKKSPRLFLYPKHNLGSGLTHKATGRYVWVETEIREFSWPVWECLLNIMPWGRSSPRRSSFFFLSKMMVDSLSRKDEIKSISHWLNRWSQNWTISLTDYQCLQPYNSLKELLLGVISLPLFTLDYFPIISQ